MAQGIEGGETKLGADELDRAACGSYKELTARHTQHIPTSNSPPQAGQKLPLPSVYISSRYSVFNLTKTSMQASHGACDPAQYRATELRNSLEKEGPRLFSTLAKDMEGGIDLLNIR